MKKFFFVKNYFEYIQRELQKKGQNALFFGGRKALVFMKKKYDFVFNELKKQMTDYKKLNSENKSVVEEMFFLLNEGDFSFLRAREQGHFTASAWIFDPKTHEVLLTHHKKLDRWLQLGGHADGEFDLRNVALNEASEESGIPKDQLKLIDFIFDMDIHSIPEFKGVKAHLHYDVRYFIIPMTKEIKISDESNDLAWIPLGKINQYTQEASVLRMVQKTQHLLNQLLDEQSFFSPSA